MSKSGFSYPDHISVGIWDFQTKLGESWRDREGWTVYSQYKMKIKWPKVQNCKLYIKCTCVRDSDMRHFGVHVALERLWGQVGNFWAVGILFLNIYPTCMITFFIPFPLAQFFFYVLCPPLSLTNNNIISTVYSVFSVNLKFCQPKTLYLLNTNYI